VGFWVITPCSPTSGQQYFTEPAGSSLRDEACFLILRQSTKS